MVRGLVHDETEPISFYVDKYRAGENSMRGERYIQIPGSKTHELPPLLVHAGEHAPAENVAELDSVMLEAEDMLAASGADNAVLEQRKFDLAVQLAEQYKTLCSHWQWGDSVLEWIRQGEITF